MYFLYRFREWNQKTMATFPDFYFSVQKRNVQEILRNKR